MRISRKSVLTGHIHTMELNVTQSQIDKWQGGELIQNVIPNLSASEREFLINGITPKEWEDIFGTYEDN